MTITTTQKVINIGSSKGVTIPAKDLKALGLDTGAMVKIIAEPAKSEVPEKHSKLMKEYSQFVDQYGQTLKNLKDR